MPEWTVELRHAACIDSLRGALEVELAAHNAVQRKAQSVLPDVQIAYRVARIGNLVVEVFSDEHPPPHFRVRLDQDSANFTIEDCQPLTDGLERYHRAIKKWHGDNRELLIETWNERRPADCPVGEYRAD